MLATVQLVEAASTRWAETVAVRSTPVVAWADRPMPLWMQRLHDTLVSPATPLLVKQFVCKVQKQMLVGVSTLSLFIYLLYDGIRTFYVHTVHM